MGNVILFLFSLPFLGMGGAAAREGLLALNQPRPDVMALLIAWPVGALFFSIGLLIFSLSVFGETVPPGSASPLEERKRQLGIKSPRQQWSEGRITSNSGIEVVFAWGAVALLLVMTAPGLYVAITRGLFGRLLEYQLCGLVAIFPLVALAKAAYKTLRWRRFGASVCEILDRPSARSGELRCVVRSESVLLPAGDSVVSLRCERREEILSGDDRSVRVTVLWKDERRSPTQLEGAPIDAAFDIPAEHPDATASGRWGIFWVLTAHRSSPGVDYHAEFDLALTR